MCRMCRSVHRDVPNVFVCIGMGARACDRHIPNVPTQTYRHIRDKMAVVAVSLATIPDIIATLLVVNTKIRVWRYWLFAQNKTIFCDQQKMITVRIWVNFGMRIHASVSSARGRLAPPMNAESIIMREKMQVKQTGIRIGTRPPAYYDVTGHTGISRRDMQTSAPCKCGWPFRATSEI